MPCSSDHMEANPREAESREVAAHLCYVYGKLGKPVGHAIAGAAGDYYGNESMLDEFTAELCGLLGGMDDFQMERIVWDGKNKQARALADWWERHETHDRNRELNEKAERERVLLVAQAVQKLTNEEIEALCYQIKTYGTVVGGE